MKEVSIIKNKKLLALLGAFLLQFFLGGYWYYVWRMDQVVNEGANPPSLLVIIGSSIAIWSGVIAYIAKKN